MAEKEHEVHINFSVPKTYIFLYNANFWLQYLLNINYWKTVLKIWKCDVNPLLHTAA